MMADIGIKIGQFVDRKETELALRVLEAHDEEEARLAEVAVVIVRCSGVPWVPSVMSTDIASSTLTATTFDQSVTDAAAT